ncbi:CHASE2 domain-containing protein [Geminisphaera colitermitum]|uniref:CHASE2 domain-containing protein n=1 Tax=Geminisphaera colitermitum TaxID=1148786 RepID=UPI0009DD77AE|nr:adenylate/guanylate cyclase domain-containing protein [Geminisphaera colitermitum]
MPSSSHSSSVPDPDHPHSGGGGEGATRRARRLWRSRWLAVALLPLAMTWALLDHTGVLQPLKDATLDWRFRWRGPIHAAVNVVYVDIDSPSINALGNFPWDHKLFASVCEPLVKEAGVKAIGIDVVMSEAGMPQIANRKTWAAGHEAFGKFLFGDPFANPPLPPPPVALGASYLSAVRRDAEMDPLPGEIPPPDGVATVPPERPMWRDAEGNQRPAPYYGLIDTLNNNTRTVPLFAPLPEGGRVLHLSLELARLYWGVSRDDVTITPDYVELRRPVGTGARTGIASKIRIPMVGGQYFHINWFSPWESAGQNARVSFSDVFLYSQMLHSEDEDERLAAREFFAQDGFHDAVILIGATDPLMHDLETTPFDLFPVPKVGVYGNALKTLVSGRFLRFAPPWSMWAITGVLAYLLTRGLAGAQRLPVRITSLLLVAGYVAAAFVVFAEFDLVLPLAGPVGGALTAGFVGLGVQVVIEQRQRSRLQNMFGTYVSPSVVKQILESGKEPRLGGVEEEITAYFSDVQLFASASEKLAPTQLVELMNEYLSACTDVVQAESGTLDKFVGDAVVAMFGAPVPLPDHAHRACLAAVRAQQRTAELRERWSRQTASKWPVEVLGMRTRIGLNSGPAVVGNMGSRSRFNYTMMGDTVNLAARLESAARHWGVFTLCTEATRAGCEAVEPGRVVFRALNKIVVKGRTQPVDVYEVVGLREQLSADTLECVQIFGEGLRRYHARDWEGAKKLFSQSVRLEPNKPGENPGVILNPSLALLEMVRELEDHLPLGDWDGSLTLRQK